MPLSDSVNVSLCNIDLDCQPNQYCSYDDNTMEHKCIPKNKKSLYQGCLNTSKYNEFNQIVSKNEQDKKNMDSCVSFVRNQKNQDGLSYNYMIYKNKKNSFVDMNTVNIYLKCNEELLLVMGLKEFFDYQCDKKQQKCILKPNQTFRSFILSNQQTCGGQLSLDIKYSCENENINGHQNIPIDIHKLNDIHIQLTCPVNVNDNRFQSVCRAAYFDTNDSNPTNTKFLELLDKNISPENCVQPVYKVPRIIQDKHVYQQLKNKSGNKKIREIQMRMAEKENEMNQMKAQELKMKYKLYSKKEIGDEEALKMVEMNKTEYFQQNSSNCNYRIHEHKSIFGGIIEENDVRKYTTPIDGTYYMIEDAQRKACDLHAPMFIWFSNSYPLSNLRSKMFVITPSQLDRIKKDFKMDDWKKWKKVENVHIGVFMDEFTSIKEKFEEYDETYTDTISNLYNKFQTFYEKNVENSDEKINHNQQNLHKIDNKITKITQEIKMNQHEQKVNDQLLRLLYLIFIVLFLIILFYFIYKKYIQP
jgi:hypothetical protein